MSEFLVDQTRPGGTQPSEPVSTAEKRALLARRLRDTSSVPQVLASEPVAIIGLACRFPGRAGSPAAFWELLRDGVDGISKIPADRWDPAAYYSPDPQEPGKMTVQWGGFLEDVRSFDADFFGIAPREAERMDPQQRLLLEVAWEALETAGLTRAMLSDSLTGVFIGASTHDYADLQLADRPNLNAYVGSGTAHSIIANRLSYLLNLQGPSMAIDTACSSSLVAVHLACQSLRAGDSDQAIAGGVNLILNPEPMIALSKAQMMAPDGRCKTFDARANGYVRSEGCGIVVLKRLADALADHDTILAIIRGSAVNQDGRTTGLTAPSGRSQQLVLRQALENAGLTPAHVSYIEAHGTGTSLGDPIEIEALTAVLGQPRPAGERCYIGSVKTNIGHLEAAAGIAGLIKTVLALQAGQIPPHLHFQTLNPNINLRDTPFSIPTSLTDWPAPAGPVRRCAGVSSFGFGGTNAHIILEEAPRLPEPDDRPATGRPWLLPLSAHSPDALRSLAAAYEQWLSSEVPAAGASLPAVVHTAGRQRTHHPYRLAAVGSDPAELASLLALYRRGESSPNLHLSGQQSDEPLPPVFVFSGQGAEAAKLDAGFLTQEPVFAAALQACDQALAAHSGWSVIDLLTGASDRSWLDTEVAQPATFAIQVALAALWQAWGIEPAAVIGHSVGEIAAAHVAGILTLEEAAWLVWQRGRLMQPTRGQGRMAAIQATLAEAEALVEQFGPAGRLEVAAMNSPSTIVLSGDESALEEVAGHLAGRGRFARFLAVDFAFHSEAMAEAAGRLAELAQKLQPRTATTPYVSTVTGRLCAGPELNGDYWGQNVRRPVKLAAALDTVLGRGLEPKENSGALAPAGALLVELGPHPVLQRSLQQNLQTRPGQALATLRQGQPQARTLAQAAGSLYAAGQELAWDQIYRWRDRPLALPAYPWQRQHYWLPAPSRPAGPDMPTGGHPFLGRRQFSPLLREIIYESRLGLERQPLLAEHQLHGAAVAPAVILLEMVLSAAVQGWAAEPPLLLEDVFIQAALLIDPRLERSVQVVLSTQDDRQAEWSIYSAPVDASGTPQAAWTRHASGRLTRLDAQARPVLAPPPAFERPDEMAELPVAAFYQTLSNRGLVHGPAYRVLNRLQLGTGQVVGTLDYGDIAGGNNCADRPFFAPEAFEGCLQVAAAALLAASSSGPAGAAEPDLYIPLAIDRCLIYDRPAPGPLVSQAWQPAAESVSGEIAGQAAPGPETHRVSVLISAGAPNSNDHPAPLLLMEGLTVKRVTAGALDPTSQKPSPPLTYEVTWQPAAWLPAVNGNYSAPPADHWLLLADHKGIAQALADRLRTLGHACTLVTAGPGLHQLAAGHWTVNPASPADFQQFWATLEPAPDRLLFLWSLDEAAGYDLIQGAFHLVQTVFSAWAERQAAGEKAPQLWYVTRGLHPLVSEPATAGDPLVSALWGLGGTVLIEQPALWGGAIDLDLGLSPAEAAELLLTEITAPSAGLAGERVAYRAGQRLVARLQEMVLPPSGDGQVLRLKPQHTYLVTGGLGAIGRKLIRRLVDRGARYLAVTSRQTAAANQEKLNALLSELPGDVTVRLIQVDFSQASPAAVADLIAEVDDNLPSLAGIFHLAGHLDDGLLINQSWDRFERVLAVKAGAAFLLHQVTLGRPLDFFVLFSSAAGLLGSLGQGSYAAANAAMDGLAHIRRAQGLPALSINWGVWASAGMSATLSGIEQGRLADAGLRPLGEKRALDAMEQLLTGCDQGQAAVLALDWQQARRSPAASRLPLLSDLLPVESESPAAAEAPLKAALFDEPVAVWQDIPAEERQQWLTAWLVDQLRQALGLPADQGLDLRRGFFQLGMDSLMAMEIQQRLQKHFGLLLPATVVFDYPYIEALVDYLAGRLWPEELPAGLSADEPQVAQSPDVGPAEIEQLSDGEIDDLLARYA